MRLVPGIGVVDIAIRRERSGWPKVSKRCGPFESQAPNLLTASVAIGLDGTGAGDVIEVEAPDAGRRGRHDKDPHRLTHGGSTPRHQKAATKFDGQRVILWTIN